MKKIFILTAALLVLTACGNSGSIEEAKKAMLEGETNVSSETQDSRDKDPLDISDGTSSLVETAQSQGSQLEIKTWYTIEQLDETKLLEFNDISIADIQNGEVEISGTTLGQVDKITVSFENKESSYPNDLYTLLTFKAGAKTFKYSPSSRFKVLDFGVNTYIFTAYTGRETSETKLTINLIDPKANSSEELGETQKLIGTEVSAELASLPIGWNYGNPVMLWEDAFTYSDINGLEINKIDVTTISCDGDELTNYLSDNINTWFYWNTCRDLIKDKAISFNVIRLEGEQYIYQKHYVDFINSFYGTYDIQTGTGVTKDNIAEKNTELKELNDTFSNVSLVDGLFKDIVN